MDHTTHSVSYALSSMQKGMLFSSIYLPVSGADIEQIQGILREPLDISCFEMAWERLIQQHDLLRTRFLYTDQEEPKQEIVAKVQLPIAEHNLRHLSPSQQQNHLISYLRNDRQQGFDFSQPPLMRVALFQTNNPKTQEPETVFVWTFHHIILDGRSQRIVLEQLFDSYESLVDNQHPVIHNQASVTNYKSYISWLGRQNTDRSREFWKTHLQGVSAPSSLPTDQPKNHQPPATSPYLNHAEQEIALPIELTKTLAEVAHQNDMTMNTLVQGAWACLLSHHSGEQDIIFGALRAGRHGTDADHTDTVGIFINTLPIRAQVNPKQIVRDYLSKLRQQQIDLRAHEHTPLVDVQSWSGLPGGVSLFDSILVFDNYLLDHALKAKGGAWQNRDFRLYEQTIYPLALYGYGGEQLTLKLNYDCTQFSAQKIAQLLGHLENLLKEMIAKIDQPLSSLEILTPSERNQILIEWNETEVPYPRESCIHHLFEQQAAKTPAATALVFQDESLTYSELNGRANQVAHALLKQGVGPDKVVGVYMDRSITMMVGLLGILKAGGAYLPLDPAYPQDRLDFMIEDAKVGVILADQQYVARLASHETHILALDTEWPQIATEDDSQVTIQVEPHHLSYLIYTSGSTGRPKGVMVEHRNVVNFFAGMDQRIPRGSASSRGDGSTPDTNDHHNGSTTSHPINGSFHAPNGIGSFQDRTDLGDQDIWLAVTSLSFDISVLELFWPLARGFKIILHADKARLVKPKLLADDHQLAASSQQPLAASQQPPSTIDFSLFYFASDESEQGVTDKYQLLMDGAKFADQNGFSAIWTPERHFHAFGGLYPNPSVISAAIAATTENVAIRAGSCVLPLHHPARVVEEWSVVDNLSSGRVGISFAAGWQPNDFALRPENHADRKNIMFRDIETVRKLWRGEAVAFPGPQGKDIEISTLPRPVQEELPIWVTAAGNPETFRSAGAGGFNVLTHLLGQSVDELGDKIAAYRLARKEAGFDGPGHVTIMLHTFVGDDIEAVKEVVREPMKSYLRSSVALVKDAAWSFPALKQKADASGKSPMEMLEDDDLTPEDMDALLDFAFERYFENSGLFGTPESCATMVDALATIGIDEIACLIDFGVPTGTVMNHLSQLNELRSQSHARQVNSVQTISDLISPSANAAVTNGTSEQPEGIEAQPAKTIPQLLAEHNVTHFQCTPSQMTMLLMEEGAESALATLQICMLGGEALPVALASRLNPILNGQLINMYGPTETTIWSSTNQVVGAPDSISVGHPIANTQIYIVDDELRPVPVGVPGELWIGGDGVVRGYLERPELTAERFIRNPFVDVPAARVYRTGDLARYRPDGQIDFLGRADFQVKIRGHRIELGEIETLLSRHPSVTEAVVIARPDATGSQRMIAYMLCQATAKPETKELRDYLGESLPDFMVPNAFVHLDAFPQTPNGKVDRKALPDPSNVLSVEERIYEAPRTPFEEEVTALWADVLDTDRIGIHDNFFELGGHSLSAIQVAFRIRRDFGIDLPLQTFFDKPTLGELSEELQNRLIATAPEDDLADLMAELDDLSEEELQLLLKA